MDRGFLLAVCFSVLVTGVLSQQGPSILSIIPDNSQTSWTLRDFPGVNGNLSPPSFMLAGPVAITVNQVDQSTGQPKVIYLGAASWPEFHLSSHCFTGICLSSFFSQQATWQSSNLTTSPPILSGQLVSATGGSSLGSFTFVNPQVQLYGEWH